MPSSHGSPVRGSHIVMGLALLVMGSALLVIALARQAERARGAEPVPACVGSGDVMHDGVGSPHEMTVVTPTSPAMASIHDAGVALSSSQGAFHDSGLEAGADAEADLAGTHDFFFLPGTLALPREERQRLTALGIALARHPDIKLTVQGFGDQAGGDTDTAALARRRARIGEVLLTRAGVIESRMTTSVGDPAAEPHLARAIHVVAATAPVEVDP